MKPRHADPLVPSNAEPTDINGFEHYRGFLGDAAQLRVLRAVKRVIAKAPLYIPTMPRTGKPLSVRMTNCGKLGWVTDKEGGYRYQREHPETGELWPAIPAAVQEIWRAVALGASKPEACLINWYGPGAKLGLHVDSDEEDTVCPVVSISLGDDAVFRLGGIKRRDRTRTLTLRSGDVVVLGGKARFAHHGVDRILPGSCELLDQPGRINLTLRRVTLAKQ